MAEKAAAEEISEEQRQSGIFSRVQNAIESGSFQEQVVAVTLLRLTPVVPFRSAATPLKSIYILQSRLCLRNKWNGVASALVVFFPIRLCEKRMDRLD